MPSAEVNSSDDENFVLPGRARLGAMLWLPRSDMIAISTSPSPRVIGWFESASCNMRSSIAVASFFLKFQHSLNDPVFTFRANARYHPDCIWRSFHCSAGDITLLRSIRLH
jgi:hypothetical protein